MAKEFIGQVAGGKLRMGGDSFLAGIGLHLAGIP